MEDIDKTKDELIAELELLRSEVAALQQAGRSQSATGLPPTASAVPTLTLPDSLGLATRPEATGQYTILFVDDSEVDRATYRRFLLQDSDRTYNIVEFDNGEDALQWCQHQIPDILLLDYYLPDIDGLELLEELLQQTGRNTLPAIVLTGQGNLQMAVDLLKSGAQDYLQKSQITPEVLQRSISYVLRHSQLMREREWQRQQQQILAKTALAIRDSLKLEDILNTTVTEIRNILLCDRVIIFQLAPDLSGRVVVESVGSEARPILSTQIHDPCLSESYFERFRQGLVTAKSDIYRAQIAPCHLEFLTNLQVRANLVVPILQGENLWGLLIAHHCVAPREWQASEIELLRQLSAQASIAIQQADLLEQLQTELRERKQAELTLEETQEKLQLFIKYAPASIVMFDRSMCYLAASQRWVDEFEIDDLESIIGRSHYELFPDLPLHLKQSHQRGFAGLVQKCEEDKLIYPDGSQQWFRWEVHPWYRSNGDVGGIIVFSDNITDRKQAELTLEETQEKLQLFIKYAPASIVMFDRSMCYLAASQRWVDEYLLNDLGSIIGRSHYELFPNIPEEWKQFHQRGFAGFIEKCDEDRFVHSDGSLQWLRWEIHPWYRSNGDVGGIILFTEDITDRKQAQIALQQINTELEKRVTERTAQLTEVNDRLLVTLLEKDHAYQLLTEQAQLLDLAHDSIITWDLNSVITFWNQGAELMYGWTKAEAFGQESHSLFKTQFPQPLAEIQAELFETGYWEGELIHYTRDDRQITVSSRWVVQKDDAGRPIKILEINSDVTQRKAAELVLQQYIHEVEDLYNNAPCGYHSLDAEGTMVRINDTELKWLGYTRDELLYKIKFLDLLSPDGKQVFYENFPKLKQQGWVENLEFEMSTKDGSSRWFNLNATAIEDAAGNFMMTRSTLFDISDRKQSQREREQAELALRESEEQRRLALEQKSRQESLLWTITQAIRQSLDLKDILNTTVTEVKQTLQVDRAAIYRFTPDWSGDFVVESVDPQWVKLVECNIQKACEDVYLQETKGGRFRNHETFAIADIDEAGLHPCHIQLLQQFQAKAYLAVPIFSGEFLWGLLIIYQNTAPRNWQSWEIELLEQISSQLAIAIQQSQLYTQLELELQERQQAEAIIREAERRWRSLLENVQLIVVGLDASGNINYVNPFFVGLTGYTHEEVLGKNWFENFLPSSSIKSTEADFLQLLTHNAHPYYRNVILTKSGEERFIAWNNTTLQDSDGTAIGSISIGEDITERNKIEQIKDEFIGIVSHELRTPLTAIQMSLGLLKTGIYDKKPEKSRRMIEIALLDTNRLVNLVNDILDLERLESGRAFLDKTLCKAADLMQQVVDALQAIANQHQISLIIIPTDAEVWAAADAILQTLTNLLSNALKFSPVGATIYLSAENQTDCVLFQVRDRGRGIPADKLELVFGRFQQVDASDSREKGGTGLGLPICRSIIEQHGGKIWAESILGEGSTFFFTLPLPAIE
ncbi:MAG: PAS domain S-box protein [Oscillatoriales cyanobacterium]|uniref:PAS domain S-box protein n=1 Tax=unclassified Microcoleus TaxID=2642155 RepID=UPI001D302B0B|nr:MULTISPECIES: PAS domain S-box protein [unclassified Microcoleus]TAG63619.1 MAG: PAS domain S-box protein [Oscillatoriales cyanobacterium]MCC3456650.1 PAS domain S-box protein [Microcoleus sp. PH2017_08_TRC_O_A]MCC3568465.1 PAS domain S-box protein [Microcoleus sp. PH2017_31_RDM_U_A]MCC3580742.1 PAS domain S-box protein [Microcoleus sp. PH2017_32_RDM_D_A]MCC3618851.1 PAS domain S-box protein [Microcoleus sp. PH2017_38_RDM_U_B]